jgi:hypothetical protein
MGNGCELFRKIRAKDLYNPDSFDNDSCAHAVISGNIEMLLFVRSYGCQWEYETANLAAACNHLHILKYLEQNNCQPSKIASLGAATNGNIDMMCWLIDNKYEIRDDCLVTAARFGNLEMLKFLKQLNYNWTENDICSRAVVSGSLPCLQWTIENGYKLNVSDAYYFAARFNKINIFKWMMNEGYIWDSLTCETAKNYGNFELLKMLY